MSEIEKDLLLEELKNDVASIRRDVSLGLWCCYALIGTKLVVDIAYWVIARFQL